MKRAIIDIGWDEVSPVDIDLQKEKFNEILSDSQSMYAPMIILLQSPQISHGLVPDADTSQD